MDDCLRILLSCFRARNSACRFEDGDAEVAEADFKSGLGFGLGEGGTRLSPPEDEDVEVGDADPAAIISFSSSIIGSPGLMRSLKLSNV